MPDPQISPTPPRADLEPIVFHPKEPPRPLRRALNASYDVILVALIVVLLADGPPGPLLVIAIIGLGLGWIMRAAAWISYRRDPESHRFDPRREVVLTPSLVGRVRELQRQDRRSEAFKLLQGETDLGFGDTVRALELVRESGDAR